MINDPFKIRPDAFVIPSYWQQPGSPVGVHFNTMVLRSREPVVFDTGVDSDRDQWLAAVSSVVDPLDVRWIVLSHDDRDHTGNLTAAIDAFPRATVVSSWFLSERMYPDLPIDPRRQRWVGAGDILDIGDRRLVFIRPPLYDSPTTRIVFDPVGGTLWAGDLFATPVVQPTNDAAELAPDFLAEGFMQFQRWNSPWYEMLEPRRFVANVDKLAALGIKAIASTHGPAYRDAALHTAFDLLRAVVDGPAPAMPDQSTLDGIVAAMLAGAA